MTPYESIRAALSYVPAHDRETWVRMAMAVKAELGDDGFDVWSEWSSQDESYTPTAAKEVWKSVKSNGKVGIGTLFYEAKQRGYQPAPEANGHTPSAAEIAQRERIKREAIAADEAERKRQRDEAANKAAKVWKAAIAAGADHPYLVRQCVQTVTTLRELDARTVKMILGYPPRQGDVVLTGRLLIVPVKIDNSFSTLELIDEAGNKSALAGGAKRGGYWASQTLPDGDGEGLTLAIGEGVATVLSACQATGHPGVAALSSGNLCAVTGKMQQRYPHACLVELVDLGAGEKVARDAARDFGALVAVPDFGDSRPDGAKDFNDMYRLRGADAVRCAIEAARTADAEAQSIERAPANAQRADIRTPYSPSANAAAAVLEGRDWPEPKPIQAALRPVEPFDPRALLPDALRDWVMDEAERMPCPPDFIAAALVVALGSAIGARCAIKPKSRDPWLVVPNLWGGVVGLPAAKKSPAMAAAFKPLDRLSVLAQQAHAEQMDAYDVDRTVFDARREAIEGAIKSKAKAPGGDVQAIVLELRDHKKAAPAEPTMRRYKTNDSTVEKLGELLRDNPTGLLVLRDELVGLVASWDREGREGDRAFFLEAWNGTSGYHTDRIGRGTIVIPNLCLSIFGGIQPDKLTAYLEQAAHALGNDGMLQRFQVLVYPDARAWEWRDRGPNKAARDRVFNVFDVLSDFDPVTWGAEPADEFNKFPHFRFDEEAQEVFMEWMGELQRDRIPKEQTEGQPLIVQHLAKYDSLFPALALVFHLAECAASGARGPVTQGAALRAAAWCEYLESHARRCYGLLADEGLRAAQSLAERLRASKLAKKLANGFTVRDVRRNPWQYLKTDHAIQAALEWLEDDGWLRRVVCEPERGRPTVRYYINPKSLPRDRDGGANG